MHFPSRPLTENGTKLRRKMIPKEKKSKKEALCCSNWDKQASNESLVNVLIYALSGLHRDDVNPPHERYRSKYYQ